MAPATVLRAVAIVAATGLVAGLGGLLGVRLAGRRAPPTQPQSAPALELETFRHARVPLPLGGVEAAELAPQPAAAPPEGTRERWSQLNTMGVRALEAGDLERAVALFEQCQRGAGDEPVFRGNLAEALARRAVARREREWPCPQCLADLARAAELAPQREDLAALLARWRTEAELERDFWREGSQHFDLAYDGERSEILHGSWRLLEELESAYTDLALVFGFSPVQRDRRRIPVVLYRREGFGALTGLGEWAGGAFDGTVRIPVEDLAREERALVAVLRHELAHAFVLASGGSKVPGWLNEGLAQWLEPERERALERARATLTPGAALFSLDELSGTLARFEDAQAVARAYAQALLAVDRLSTHYGEQVPFKLVSACKDGGSASEAFQKLTRVPLAEALESLFRSP